MGKPGLRKVGLGKEGFREVGLPKGRFGKAGFTKWEGITRVCAKSDFAKKVLAKRESVNTV